jgi:type IX secretion system PorP/SprF family membrane protein
MKRKTMVVMMMIWCSMVTLAQDPLFTQFYNTPLYVNPAFAGCGKKDLRFTYTNRLQWMKLPDPFVYQTASADMHLRGGNFSTGVIINHFSEGYLRTSTASVLLAKGFGASFDYCKPWFLNFAFKVGVGRKSVNQNKLLFADQIDASGINGFSSEAEILQTGGRTYFDADFGVLFTSGRYLFGAAAHHLTQPFDGLAGNGRDNQLPRRYTFHLSRLFGSMEDADAIKIKPTILVTRQGQSGALLMGTMIDFGPVVQGNIWYRNNISFGRDNNHSICIGVNLRFAERTAGVSKKAFMSGKRIGVSYDGELNRPSGRYTAGSMELGLSQDRYLFNDEECLFERCNELFMPGWFF